MATSIMTLALSGLVFLLLCGLSSCSGFGKHKLYSGSKENDTNLAAEEASFFPGNDSSTPSPSAVMFIQDYLEFDLSGGHFARVLLKIKASFQDTDNALYDWINGSTNGHNDYCTWRGVLCNNVTIIKLNLSHLNLGGEISPMIGHLKRLELLDLEGNALFGQIPDEIGDIFALKCLNLAQNQLSGKIPRSIYWNEVLEVIVLQQNLLVGTLSPDMCQLTRLQLFDVGRNNLTGMIPDNIGDCRSLLVLDLSHNQLTGEIPFNNQFPQLQTLALHGNKLTGRIPEAVGLMRLLLVLNLCDNYLTGTIPPILGNLDETLHLDLSGNNLTGSIPPELGNMKSLESLHLHGNQLTGQIPPEMGKLENLIHLDLSRNQLEGLIPENISSCIALNHFKVNSNNLNGTIPLEFQKLERLTYLDLSSNNIYGMIHVALKLMSLDTLDLSNNNISGPILGVDRASEHLLKLNLSGNNLSGFIPAKFGNLINIMDIDLSFNQLSGPIPREFGDLPNLVSLILNNNNLSGEVPSQLTNCISLTTLNLSNNHLSGDIPTINNFTRFTSASFLGNPDLCGNWTGSHCRIYSQQSKASLSTPVIVCISLGSVIVFCAIMIVFCYANRLFSVIMIALDCANQCKPFSKVSKGKMEDFPRLIIFQKDLTGCTYEDIMRTTENWNERYIIGSGATSLVYKCVLRNHEAIAIKRMHTRYPENLHAFEAELNTAGSIKHRNLVRLLGYSLSPHGNLLFYDYMANGSLKDILHGSSNRIDWNTRLRIALGAARGLAYLHHDCNPRIIHRDVKTSNILLDENFEAHLADFGIAKRISSVETHTSTDVMGTIGYIDPEYARTLKLTEKSDVYSYGIVLLELITRRKAVDNDSNLLQLIQSEVDDRVMDIVDSEIIETCTDIAVVRKVLELALFCSRGQPSNRPTMNEVSKFLQSLITT